MECTRGSDTGVWWSHDVAFLSLFHHSPSVSSYHYFSSFYYFDSDFWYIDMHPTLAGLYPFLLGSPARCAFLSYLWLYICLGSPARSRLSHPAVALTVGSIWLLEWLLVTRIGTHNIIFGLPWFQKYQPIVNWTRERSPLIKNPVSSR